jgi:hypothetical protein
MTRARLWDAAHAFDHPVTRWITAGVAAILVLAPLVVALLRPAPALRAELWKRCLSWMVMAPLMIGAILLGGVWTMAGVGLASAACYREFARWASAPSPPPRSWSIDRPATCAGWGWGPSPSCCSAAGLGTWASWPTIRRPGRCC